MVGHRGSQWTAEEDRRLLDLISEQIMGAYFCGTLQKRENPFGIAPVIWNVMQRWNPQVWTPTAPPGSERDRRPSKLRSSLPSRPARRDEITTRKFFPIVPCVGTQHLQNRVRYEP